ncbi:hypothetical protein HELRODRAFT_159632 [Helobdella robusta]|uniref:RRM domain-containing protein n=1 Tax=Helobdella robusta TaxID=6412 RepID=T1EP97_HELRO|nr:hypothetical protein HELRODRAFT_159632 [Helobdella robusta]ESO13037.1 hypothetical protein HELRODRAFT_159632 [Helobdella robusta]
MCKDGAKAKARTYKKQNGENYQQKTSAFVSNSPTYLYDPTAKHFIDGLAQSAPTYGLLVPNRLFVGGLGGDVTESDLKSFFSSYGPIRHCKIMLDNNGMSKGYGFVTYACADDVEKLLKKEGEHVVYKDRKLNIGPAVRKQSVVPPMFAAAPTAAVAAPQATTAAAMTATSLLAGSNIVYINGVPCIMQGGVPPLASPLPTHQALSSTSPATTILPIPLHDGLAYSHGPPIVPNASQLVPGYSMVMFQPQYIANNSTSVESISVSNNNSSSNNSSMYLQTAQMNPLSVGNKIHYSESLSPGIHIDANTGLQHLLTNTANGPTTFIQGFMPQQQHPPQIQQHIHQQPQQHLMLPAAAALMKPSPSTTGLISAGIVDPSYFPQAPYIIQSQQSKSHFQQAQGELASHSFAAMDSIQNHQFIQHLQHKQQIAFAANESLPGHQVQFIELSQVMPNHNNNNNKNSSIHSNSSNNMHNDTATLATQQPKVAGVKRLLSQNVSTTTIQQAMTSFEAPAVKILAGQSQQRIITQAFNDNIDVVGNDASQQTD